MLSTLSAIGAAISQTIGRKAKEETSTQGKVGDQAFTQQEGTPRATMGTHATANQQASLPQIKESGNSDIQRHRRKNAANPEEMRALMHTPPTRTYVGNCKRMIEKTKGHAPNGAR